MNPGLAITLRPTTPWRIGPDSGVRNRVDSVYHSDTLYSAVTGAMARLGHLDEWVAATARAAQPAVCLSSCFPFIDGVRYVTPPRHIWPPAAPAMLSARVRWKSAQFVPVGVVRDVLAGKALNEHRWSVDGASCCLLPESSAPPFRTSVRWNAAVDRLTGNVERHSVACTEFRPGAGLWTLVSFADDAARDRWLARVQAAFRWLADSGFGGERSRGWGRAEAPEFLEGILPEMILGRKQEARVEAAPEAEAQPASEPVPVGEATAVEQAVEAAPEEPAPASSEAASEPGAAVAPVLEPAPEPEPAPTPAPVPAGLTAHWMLSLFTPAAADSVDWSRGNYALVERGGRIDSPAASGDLKKNIKMIAEGSVIYASSAPCGSAPDVAPDGFTHPVFRAGFAVAIPLTEAPQ